ncbi:D-2-hydroxyacid dehydrogenase [Psychrobacillus antarcticus]|uniref:D-2-hydroxyacid dehydrogenase n=1 Tax=Psychrobacillus antarcticus TaxID=2879115 RepID=UPI002407CA9C|nr:D-2-hydroxyacid dehydrogenase [Psychrobacillus antarcticus]
MKILFSFLPKQEQQDELISTFPDAEFIFQKGLNEEILKLSQILVTYGEDLHIHHLETAVQLKWIMVASAGLEKMPIQEIANRGIIVTNVRGIHKTPMAETILAHILSIKKSIPLINENQRNGEWSKRVFPTELLDSTAIIVGPGAIGGEVGRILQAFGVHTIGCNRNGRLASYMDKVVSFDKLDEVLPQADIVISILPSTNQTKGLITYEHLQSMKPTAIFMNFGRGDVVREEYLLLALKEEKIAYAVLDVFEKEPLAEGHPFWSMNNVIVSPHVSSHSSQYVARALEIFSRNLDAWMEQKPMENEINLEKGY